MAYEEYCRQQFLNFLPEPQAQGSFLPCLVVCVLINLSRSFWFFGTKKLREFLTAPPVNFCTSSSENGMIGSSCKIVSDQAQ